ncbi:baeRF7 domain-containing protein, partial [Chroococcidiopsis sp.]|uniref:baeRF7 domain-containing protein n=1 Tax=Chroococcidiopsis sp. TaxID=3088168 RepID=UPI003F2A417D
MPTHKLGTQTQQDPIRFKNLMRQAEEKLVATGIRAQDARDLLERAKKLDDYQFWQHQSHGLAIFISANLFGYYCLPLNFDELVVVSDRFHFKPLLPLLTGDGQFYILALSQNQVRLFQGTRYSVNEIELEDVPTSIAQALRYDDPEKSLQFHTGTSGGGTGGDRAAMFHGQGAGNDDQKDNLLRYFRKVDTGLQELLKDRRSPLVLAGVDYLLPIYQQANTYPYLLDEGMTGNPDQLKAEELHALAWEIVQPHFERSQQETIARYQELAGTGKTATNIREVVSSAYYQRVESLFVPVGVQKWGRFHPDTSEVELRDEHQPGDEDLLDLAALHTLFNGGTVYAVEPEQVPGDHPLVAVLRY